MNLITSIKLYEINDGYKVVIEHVGVKREGKGSTIAMAYRAADIGFVLHPPFVPCEGTDEVIK